MPELWRLATARARGGRGRRKGSLDPFPRSGDGGHAPGWSPAAAGQRTRAAWSSDPFRRPLPPRARRQLNRFSRILEESRDVREALDVRDAREIQVPPVRLRLAGERVLEILEALSALEACHSSSFVW